MIATMARANDYGRLPLSAVECSRVLLGAVFERHKRDLQRCFQESRTSSCDSSSGWTTDKAFYTSSPVQLLGAVIVKVAVASGAGGRGCHPCGVHPAA